MRVFRYVAPMAAACAAAVMLAACGSGGGSGGERQVASLNTSSSTPSSASSATSPTKEDSKRPRFTLDMTKEEHFALLDAWQVCLIDHGVPQGRGKNVRSGADESEYPKAYQACHSMKPVPVPALDPKQNPQYMESYGAMIDCMHDKGFMVGALPNGGGWTPPPGGYTLGQEKREKIYYGCQRKAFSDDLK